MASRSQAPIEPRTVCLSTQKAAASARSMRRRPHAPRKQDMRMAGSTRSLRKCSAKLATTLALLASSATAFAQAPEPLRPYTVVGNEIPVPLTGTRGDATRGRSIVGNRQVGLCLLCHSGPFPEEKFQGTLAPDLKGAGNRWSEGQLRLRIVDSRRLYADTMMPSYYRVEGLTRVAPAFVG